MEVLQWSEKAPVEKVGKKILTVQYGKTEEQLSIYTADGEGRSCTSFNKSSVVDHGTRRRLFVHIMQRCHMIRGAFLVEHDLHHMIM